VIGWDAPEERLYYAFLQAVHKCQHLCNPEEEWMWLKEKK
jgi:hypothetical protein